LNSTLITEIAATAARLIVEEGMEYGPAKRSAARSLGKHSTKPADLPSNQMVEEEVRSYIATFCADTQPAELQALRQVAADWMQRLQAFRPHLTGAVWRGTATKLNNVHLQLFCDDAKEAEIELLNQQIAFDVNSTQSPWGQPIDVLTVSSFSPELKEHITVCLSILDFDDLRGALKPGASGSPERGDLARVQKLMGVNS
jgi:hypothetical protein